MGQDIVGRMSRTVMMEEITKLVSRRGTCLRARVGCVIERNGRILSIGYNGSLPGHPHCIDVGCDMQNGHCVRTIHAETNALMWAARRGISTDGATLYTYGWKGGCCPVCRKLALSAGIELIVEIPFDGSEKEFPWKDANPTKVPMHSCAESGCVISHDELGREKI